MSRRHTLGKSAGEESSTNAVLREKNVIYLVEHLPWFDFRRPLLNTFGVGRGEFEV